MPFIPLKRFATMNPYILVSAVNMQLRDEFESLEDLCKSQELDGAALRARLEEAGFHYDEKQRQFK